MPVFKFQDQLAASGVDNNIMAGSKFEFLPRNGVVSVYGAQNGSQGTVELSFTLGNVVVGDDLACNVKATDFTGPDRNQDLLAQGVAAAGDRIQIRAAEVHSTPAATDYRVLVQINEL